MFSFNELSAEKGIMVNEKEERRDKEEKKKKREGTIEYTSVQVGNILQRKEDPVPEVMKVQ